MHKSFHHLDLSIKTEYHPYSNTRNQCFILLGLQKKAYIETRIVEETKKKSLTAFSDWTHLDLRDLRDFALLSEV